MAKERKLTIKQRGFVEDVVKTKNPTEAVRRNYNVKNDETARVIAHENMTKPNVVNALDIALEANKLTDSIVTRIHKRNMTQKKDLRVSQTAVKDYYNIKGYGSKEHSTAPVQVAFIINTNQEGVGVGNKVPKEN